MVRSPSTLILELLQCSKKRKANPFFHSESFFIVHNQKRLIVDFFILPVPDWRIPIPDVAAA